jgi:cell division protein FtsB
MRIVTLVLVLLIGAVHGELWFGSSGVPHTMGLRAELQAQQQRNTDARDHNARLAAEVEDLKEMVEERARSELGMLRPDELLVQVTQRR